MRIVAVNLTLLTCLTQAIAAAAPDGLQGRWNGVEAGITPDFNGRDQVLELRDANLPNPGQAQTWTIWINPGSVSGQAIVGKPLAATAWARPRTGFYFSPFGTVAFDLFSSDQKESAEVTGKTRIPAQAWTFIAMTFDGRQVRIYVDGKLDASLSWAKPLGTAPGHLRMGALREFDKYYSGKLGELRLYSRALTPVELAQLQSEGRMHYPQSLPAPSTGAPAHIVMEVRRNASDQKWRSYPAVTLDELRDFKPDVDIARDVYGGRKDRRSDATGFFYAKRIDGRWWTIDPAGGYFFHNGVVAVAPGGSPTLLANFAPKFGTAAVWADRTTTLLKDHGFTGIGAWSNLPLLRATANKLPYTKMVNFMESFARQKGLTRPGVGHSGFLKDSIPVFHPDFPEFCRIYAEEKFRATRDDPWLFGLFSDNELLTPDLAKYLTLDPHEPDQKPNYEAARDWLIKKTGKASVGPGDVTWALELEFAGYAFERYFEIVSKAIRQVDPNHLYLGSRLNTEREKINPHIWRAAGKYVDVIALNLYRTWTPDQDRIADWTSWSGRPVIITEWYTKGDDAGFPNTTGAGWIVRTQADRGKFYQQFVLNLIKSKGIVGWHWFKYMDNDPADTTAEASNRDSNKGLMTLKYEPYAPMLQRMKAINQEMYQLADYFDSKKP